MASGEAKSPQYDYTELTVYNIHGQPMSVLVDSKKLPKESDIGPGFFAGFVYIGVAGDLNLHEDYGAAKGFPNIYLTPITSTLTPARGKDDRVGHMICEVRSLDGEKVPTVPRTVAQAALDQLQQEGYTLRSTMEIEFDLFDEKTGKPMCPPDRWFRGDLLEFNMDLLVEFMDELKAVGVNVESVQSEFGPGMFEFTFDVEEGLKSSDSVVRFKSTAKRFFKERGLTACFMAKPDPRYTGSGMHYNHSIWTADGKNAMVDESRPDLMSDAAKHWVAGLVKHGPALTALCSPTINCYRRVGKTWGPINSDWGVHDRNKTFRVKSEPGNVYVENRQPSAACNPYMVVAATVAAGLDGIRNKLELPPSTKPQPPLPNDLESALKTLEADDVICEALGSEVIKHYGFCKRTLELDVFEKAIANTDRTDKDKLKAEHAFYYDNV